MPNTYGVDLGTCNLKIFNKHSGQITMEKDTMALVNKNQLYAYGNDAYSMYEKAPDAIQVTFPVSGGVIADYNNMQQMLQKLLERGSRGHIRGSEFIVAVPTDITEVEKKAFFDLFYKSKMNPRRVLLCDKPIADGIGLGLDVNEPTGVMVVDIGADTTEISVISLGGLVLSELLHFGGNRLDESIVSYVKRKFNLTIGLKTACQMKEEIGSALADVNRRVDAVGMDVVSGLPVEISVDASVVYEAMKDSLSAICNAIKLTLERTPPEVSKDILRDGIYLTGGGSKVHSLDTLFHDLIKIPVNTCEDPELSVARGLSFVITSDRFEHLAYSLRPRIFR